MQQPASSTAVDSLVQRIESAVHKNPTHTAALEFLLTTPTNKCLNQHLHAIVYLLNSKQLLLLTECEYSSDTTQNEQYEDADDGVGPLENTPGVADVVESVETIEVPAQEIHHPLDADAEFLKELEKFGLGTET